MPFGTTQADNQGNPLGSVYVPGTAGGNLTPLQGGPASVDSNNLTSAPVSTYANDGNLVTLGAKADAVATSDTGTFSLMALLKRLVSNTSQLVANLGVNPPLGQAPKSASIPVTLPSDATATGDGKQPAAVSSETPYIWNAGGPPDVNGVPQQQSLSRIASLQSKGLATGLITATNAGDTILTFSSAPKTIVPGQWVQLSGSGYEYVKVAESFTPSATATVIPLEKPVVAAGHTTASWDVYAPLGPNGAGSFLPTDIGLFGLVTQDAGGYAQTCLACNGSLDNKARLFYLMTLQGMVNPLGNVDGVRANQDNVSLLPFGVVTANGASPDQTNYNGKGIKIFIVGGPQGSGASGITVSVQIKDPVSGKYQTVLTSGAIAASSDPSTSAANVLTIYPGIAPVANQSLSDVVPRTWRVAWQAVAWGTGGSSLGISAAVIN